MIGAAKPHLRRVSNTIAAPIAVGEEVSIPTPIFFFGLGFVIGGIFMPALQAGSSRLSDIAVGRISARR